MKVAIYLTKTTGTPEFVMCVNDDDTGVNITNYKKYIVSPENIVNTVNIPVSIETFLLNFNKFSFNGVDTLKQISTSVLDNRKINRLSTTTGMAIGRSNTTELFNVL